MMAHVVSGERWFRALVDAAPAMIWISGQDAKCSYFNRAWLAYTGRALADEIGDGWASGVHPEDVAECVERYQGHFERREHFRLEYRLRRADGSYGWILDDGVPRYAEDGAFLGFIGSCVDVTDHKEAQRLAHAKSVTRALVGRLLQEIVARGSVSPQVLREIGRVLAHERPPGTIGDYAETFREMGFGTVKLESDASGRYLFSACDLLEKRVGSTQPTCYVTLGFLEGAVTATTGRNVLGNEMQCQSQGHETCRFALTAR